ncbi:unnamed protein product, partial [Musa acuminata subsp. burmannicoides]
DPPSETYNLYKDTESMKSPFNRGMQFLTARYSSETMSGSDVSFVSSGRPSFDRAFPTRSSYMSSDRSFE